MSDDDEKPIKRDGTDTPAYEGIAPVKAEGLLQWLNEAKAGALAEAVGHRNVADTRFHEGRASAYAAAIEQVERLAATSPPPLDVERERWIGWNQALDHLALRMREVVDAAPMTSGGGADASWYTTMRALRVNIAEYARLATGESER